jgi:hypothetical protein
MNTKDQGKKTKETTYTHRSCLRTYTRLPRCASEDGKDRRVQVVGSDGARRNEVVQIVAVRHIVSVPADHVEDRGWVLGHEQLAHEFLRSV